MKSALKAAAKVQARYDDDSSRSPSSKRAFETEEDKKERKQREREEAERLKKVELDMERARGPLTGVIEEDEEDEEEDDDDEEGKHRREGRPP